MRYDKICRVCGKSYSGGGAYSSHCPQCAAAAKSAGAKMPRACVTCGASFVGSPRSKYCPPCRDAAAKQRAARYRRAGPARPLGSTDTCIACGQPYTVTGGLQKYCKDCAGEEIRKNDRAKSREWNRDNPESAAATKAKNRAVARPCAVCGKPFVPSIKTHSFCSDACRAARRKEHWREAEAKRGPRNSRERDKEYRAKNLEKIRAYDREWKRKRRAAAQQAKTDAEDHD